MGMESPPVPTLSAAQIQEFKERGVLVTPDALDPATCAACRDLLWTHCPPSRSRHDPASWVGPWLPEEEEFTNTGSRLNGGVKYVRSGFEWAVRSVARDELLLDLLPRRVFPMSAPSPPPAGLAS